MSTDMEQAKMATAKAQSTQKPLIQIDDEVREMTDEEYAAYIVAITDESHPVE